MNRFSLYLKALVNIGDYIDRDAAAAAIRKNVAFRGPNVLILACAIIIASVGLNVNSIPVIIGAMLISPLMGPIIGFGLGLGTRDNGLVRAALTNFVVMVVISLLASTLYFILSPLSLDNPSELLARTNPSFYDVLIALFGGFAGIVETSRKEKGTVLSGVAIATALMPPLCTVGYGFSRFDFHIIGGALYLFIINCIFIALATYLGAKYLGYKTVEEGEELTIGGHVVGGRRRVSTRALVIALVVIITPSIISAVNTIRENNFKIHAEKIAADHKTMGKSFIYNYNTNYSRKNSTLELFVAGESLSEENRELLYADAEKYGLTRSQIIIHDDATSLREDLSESEIVKGIYERNDEQIRSLNEKIVQLEAELDGYRMKEIPVDAVSAELFAQYPSVKSVMLSEGSKVDAGTGEAIGEVIAVVTSASPLDDDALARMKRWLSIRLSKDNIILINELAN